jgi:ubiquinone/menaquinone biosynthesis C-methylase UbiE
MGLLYSREKRMRSPEVLMDQNVPSPEKIMQVATGTWVCGILSAAVVHSIFNHLEGEGASVAALQEKTGISARGAQALLDGLVGVGLVQLVNGRYRNSPETSFYLVEGKPGYMGGFVRLQLEDMRRWIDFPKVVQSGVPIDENTSELPENEYWELLVPAIANLSIPLVQKAGEILGLSKAGSVSWLDVGGGSGIYSALWLKMNPRARAVQLDWANVNRVARNYVSKYGVEDRFQTIDGDFHTTDFGDAKYDFGIYSHIAHQETPQSNLEIFRKFRKALKPGGTLLISDFVLNDDRSGHPFSLTFSSMMVLHTKGGTTYRQKDYHDWLTEAGFRNISIEPTPTPATLIFAS